MAKNLITALRWTTALVIFAGCSADVSDEDSAVQSLAQDLSFDQTCNADQQSTLAMAHYFGYVYTQKAANAFDANPDSATSRRWFGNQDASGKNIIRWVFQRTLGQFARGDTKFFCNCVEQSDYAKSYNLHPEQGVFLCAPRYWMAPGIGVNSKAGILAHEFTHTSAGTDDVTDVWGDSGPANAQDLAQNSPSDTTHNAISYQYFIEETAFQ